MAYSLGVDLGTGVVTAAVARPGEAARTVALGERGGGSPAVVHVGEDDTVVTGDAAERRAGGHPDRLVRGLRRRLADGRPVVLGTAAYPVTGLLGAQLRDVVRRVSDAEGGPPAQVVLTCPATWDDARRARLVEVAAAAGIRTPLLVTEPEAAALHALAGRWADGECVAVYDLGASGFHAAVVRRRGDGTEIVGTPEADERVGGDAFDEAVLRHVTTAAGAPLRIDGDVTRAPDRLRRAATLAKETLSVAAEATVPVLLPGGPVEVRLTRPTFEQMVREPLESTMRALYRAIRSAGLLPSDLRGVLLLGGSSRIPLVAQMASQQFGRPLVRDADPENAVALGAATLGAASLDARSSGGGSATPAAGWAAVHPVAATAAGTADPVGGTVAPILSGADLHGPLPETPLLTDPRGIGAADPDGAVPALVMLDPGAASLPPGGPRPRRSLGRTWLPIAAAAVAVLVLVVVFVVAPTAAVPPAAPAADPLVTTAPSSAAPSSTGPSTTTSPTTAAASTTAAPSTPRPTRTRATATTRTSPRATASRTARARPSTTAR